ncbi:hypothetical protein [Helicobacter pylori]|uniref:hypothetical protein n=1 Tax=Helicobacter pylori TaxID=210 RepID=UPI00053494CB|nr:hypothetical protein [Helicobacter pylori]
MEQEELQPIDLGVLMMLCEKAYLPKSADKISKALNIDYYYTLKIFTNLEAKGLCMQWNVNKKREKETKNNYFKVCLLSDLGKEVGLYLQQQAKKHAKTNKKDQQ